MSFKALDYARIKQLDKRCHVYCERLNVYIAGLIWDVVARKIIQQETYFAVLSLEINIEYFNPPLDFSVNAMSWVTTVSAYSSKKADVIQDVLLLR